MNELQKCELKILLEIDRVCKEHNIHYFLGAGTLIGAIRHHGFIPWDDDLDLLMDAEDYWRFFSIAPKALGEEFFFQSTDTDLWYRAYSKVRLNNTTMIEKSYENIRFHQGVWVDIFPLIGLKNDPKAVRKVDNAIAFSDLLVQDAFFDQTENLPLKLRLIKAVPLSVRRRLCKKIRQSVFRPSSTEETCDNYWGFPFRSPRFVTESFRETILVPFEGHMMPVPKGYDTYLTTAYGDYMTPPPPEKRGGTHNIAILDLENDYTAYLNGEKKPAQETTPEA